MSGLIAVAVWVTGVIISVSVCALLGLELEYDDGAYISCFFWPVVLTAMIIFSIVFITYFMCRFIKNKYITKGE